MRKNMLFLSVIFAVVFRCNDTENIDNIVDYFPMKLGDIWLYDRAGSQNNPYLKREITDQIQMGDKQYFIVTETWQYNEQNPIIYIDTLRPGVDDRIFKYHNGEEYLLYDFTLNSGDTYIDSIYSVTSDDNYTVTFRDIDSLETTSGKFYNCIELLFYIPQCIDGEVWYIFAPGVGLIKRWSSEGPTFTLNSYLF